MTRLARKSIAADVCVVGAGIVGLAHAFEARRRGLRVVVLEQDAHAVGASVRNFGHVFLSGMGAGEELARGLLARERWLTLGAQAGLEISCAGTLVVARHEDELEILQAAADDRARGAQLLTAGQAGELAPIPTDGLIGALHGTLDLRVDPRTTVARLAALLERDDAAEIRWQQRVHEIEPGLVSSDSFSVTAPMIVICPGPAYGSLPLALRAGLGEITRCKLQMLRVAAPEGRRYRPALLTGLSLVRYRGFADQPAAERLRTRLSSERPELLQRGIHLLITQLPDGDLIVGDSHDYGEPVVPYDDARIDALLIAEACALLGTVELQVRQRWHGIYPSAPGRFVIAEPMAGVRLVEVVNGLGMSLSFGLAPAVLDALLAERAESTGALA